jgi:hypothetical protein
MSFFSPFSFFNSSIITDGLLLNLDAGNSTSYPSTGTTWTDLSSNGRNGTLTNGPTFNSADGGAIVFDGIDDYVNPNNVGTVYTTNNFTVQYWCLPTATTQLPAESTSGVGPLSGNRFVQQPPEPPGGPGATSVGTGVAVGTNGIAVIEHGSGYFPSLLTYTGTISNTVFTHIVVTYTSKQPRLYINGTLARTGLTSTFKDSVNLTSGQYGGFAYGYFQGRIANIIWYNRVLSTDEITQNYNALVGRYI